MSKGDRGTILIVGSVALCVIALSFALQRQLAPNLKAIPGRPVIDLSSCGYEDAEKAARDARQRQLESPIPANDAVSERLSQRIEQAESAKEDAKACEDRLHNQADLDAQWAAALSARNASHIALSQWRWAAAEFGALALALLAAGWAAWEARKAAHAAREALEFERNPILIASIEGDFGQPPFDPITQQEIQTEQWSFKSKIRFRNAGRGPATLIDVQAAMGPGLGRDPLPKMTSKVQNLASGEWSETINYHHTSKKTVRRGINDDQTEAPLLCVSVRALYQNATGELLVYGAAWEYLGLGIKFIPTGGIEFNYLKPLSEVGEDVFDLRAYFKIEKQRQHRPDQP